MTMTIEEAAKELATRLEISTPEGESSPEFRLSFARLLYINDLKTELMELAESRTLRVRRLNGGPLPGDSMVSESSQVDIAEAQAALEGMGRKFIEVQIPESEKQEEIRKRVALIEEVRSFWPDIATDLNDSVRNGLNNAAKHKNHGYWKVEPAIQWAIQRGKITKNKAASFVASNGENILSPMLRYLLKLD